MKIEFSGFGITAGRGRWGSDSISRNHYGPYLKTSVYGSGFSYGQYWQDLNDTSLSAARDLWLSLDPDNQQEWIDAARMFKVNDVLGNQHSPSGYHLFMKQTTGLFFAGQVPSLLPVIDFAMPQIANVLINSLESGLFEFTIEWRSGGTISPSDCRTVVCASPCQSPGRTRLYSNIGIIDMIDENQNINNYDLTGQFNFFKGALVPGRKVFMKCYPLSIVSGMRGVPVTAVGIVSL